MMVRKLFIIIMGIFLVICAGSCNIYPLYLKTLMDKFGYSLKQVNLYGSFINLGLWVAFPMGYVYDRFGPKISCIFGGFFLSGSYLILYFIMSSSLTSFPIFPILLIGLVMGQGSALCYTCSLTTNLKNFRFKDSSCIVGLLVANMAISPSIFTSYKQYLDSVVIAHYFLIISIFLAIVIALCGFAFRNIQNAYSEEEDIQSYEKYKEKKFINVFILINLINLVLYTFGVIFNNMNSTNKFPNVIIFPILQFLNFIVLIFEYYNVFDRYFFKEFIDSELLKQYRQDFSQADRRGNKKIVSIKEEKQENINKYQQHPTNQNEKDFNKFQEEKFQHNEIKENANDQNDIPRKIETEVKENNSKEEVNNPETPPAKEKSIENQEVPIEINEKEKVHLDAKKTEIIEDANENKFQGNNKQTENNVEIDFKIQNEQKNQENKRIENDQEKHKVDKIKIEEKVDIDFYAAVNNRKIVVMFIMLTLGIGSMIANLNNIEFIIKSISYGSSTQDIYEYIVLYFAFNSFFRIISGIILDKLIQAKKFYHFFIIMTFVGLFSQFLGIFMDRNLLFLSISLAGATHGGYMTFIPVYVRTEYGTTHMGKILGVLTTGCALGSLVIADLIFTIFYDIYNVDGDCYGKVCYYPSYIISSVFMVANCFMSFYVYKIHTKIEVKKFEIPKIQEIK